MPPPQPSANARPNNSPLAGVRILELGQLIDVALYETVLNLMESVVAEFDKAGVVREREGMRLTGIVPSGTYPCRDGAYIVIGANSDSIFKRFTFAIGRSDLASDHRLAENKGRCTHIDEIDDAISAWTRQRPAGEVLRVLEEAEVPAGPINSAKEMLADPQFQARRLFEEVDLGDGDHVKLPAVAPKLSDTPGGTRWIDPPLGAHNREIYSGLLGYSEEKLRALASSAVI